MSAKKPQPASYSVSNLRINGVEVAISERVKASNYQVAMGRVELLAEHIMNLESTDMNHIDALAGAIQALAKLALRENEI